MLLEDLSNLSGVSGNEDIIRDYIINQVAPFCDSVKTDRAGNVLALVRAQVRTVPGQEESVKNVKKVMLAAHMDEVGFIVKGIDKNGNLKFMTVGGIDPKVLPGCRVLVGDNDIKGVIGAKAIHLQSEAEFKKTFSIESLRIDIGCENRKQAEKLVEPGDYVVFDTVFEEFGQDLYSGKAFDDRVGCAILIELLKNMKRPEFDLFICFSVKEEIGLMGAKILANEIKPDIAIIVEGTTCADMPGVEQGQASSRINKGPVLAFMDGASVSDKELNGLIIKTAEQNHIPYQFKTTITGGNDAAAIQRNAAGAQVASISVPCRYIHSPVGVISRQDYDDTFYLLAGVIENLCEKLNSQ